MIPLDDDVERVNLCGTDGANTRREAARERSWTAYEVRAVPALIHFLHACAGFPTKARWIECIKRNYYQGWPGLSAKRVQKYLDKSEYTTYGRQRLIKKGIRSSASRTAKEVEPTEEEKSPIKPIVDDDPARTYDTERPLGLGLPPMRTLRERQHAVGTFVTDDVHKLLDKKNLTPKQYEELKHMIATDQTGEFPVTSAAGHKALFVMYDYDSNFINAVPIKSRSATELLRAWKECYKELKLAGFYAVLQRLDNEVSKNNTDDEDNNGSGLFLCR